MDADIKAFFDVKMAEAGYGLVRYADDFVIFARSEEQAEAALGKAEYRVRTILERMGTTWDEAMGVLNDIDRARG